MITHDLGVIAETVDRVVVLYGGRVMETGPVEALFEAPLHPYTRALLASIPGQDARQAAAHRDPRRLAQPVEPAARLPFHPRCPIAIEACRAVTPALERSADGRAVACLLAEDAARWRHERSRLELHAITKRYDSQTVVDRVNLAVPVNQVVALVGESGSSKTTTGLMALRLVEPSAGRILLGGDDITHLPQKALKPFRRRMQVVFQDSYASLDPMMTLGEIIAEPARHPCDRHSRSGASEARGLARRSASTAAMPPLPAWRTLRRPAASACRRPRAHPRPRCWSPTSRPRRSMSPVQAQIVSLLQDLHDRHGPLDAVHQPRSLGACARSPTRWW